MSAAEAPAAETHAAEVPVAGREHRPVRSDLRFFAAELRLVLFRRRNLLLLAVTAVFPLVIGIALRLAAPHPDNGGGGGPGAGFFNQLAGNGVFLTFIALSTLLVLVLPVVVSVVAGDSVAGEASAVLGDASPEQICAELVQAGIGVRGFAVTSPSLEDLFVGLTGEGFDVSG